MPKKGDNFDFHYCNAPEKMGLETEERYRLIKASQKCKDNFLGFYYFNRYGNNTNLNDIENNNIISIIIITFNIFIIFFFIFFHC